MHIAKQTSLYWNGKKVTTILSRKVEQSKWLFSLKKFNKHVADIIELLK